jgi:hypothetical protein
LTLSHVMRLIFASSSMISGQARRIISTWPDPPPDACSAGAVAAAEDWPPCGRSGGVPDSAGAGSRCVVSGWTARTRQTQRGRVRS